MNLLKRLERGCNGADRREQRCSGCVTHTGSKIPSALPPQPLILSDGNQATDSDVIIIHVVNHLLLWEKKTPLFLTAPPHPTPFPNMNTEVNKLSAGTVSVVGEWRQLVFSATWCYFLDLVPLCINMQNNAH